MGADIIRLGQVSRNRRKGDLIPFRNSVGRQTLRFWEVEEMSLRHFARGAISAENARRQMLLRGVTPNGHPLWNRIEAGNLIHGHPDYKAILVLNSRRTRPAHYGKAGRLGITRPQAPRWDENELPRLHRMFRKATQAELLAAFPGRSWAAICKRANADGYHRAPRVLKPTGSTLLDQILQRARQMNWSSEDLDKAVGRKGYFRKRKWRNGRFDHTAHNRAVAALGGRLRARPAVQGA